MVCNAGIGFHGTLEDTTPDIARRLVDVNVLGTLYAAHAAHRGVRAPGIRPHHRDFVRRRPARRRGHESVFGDESGADRLHRGPPDRVPRHGSSRVGHLSRLHARPNSTAACGATSGSPSTARAPANADEVAEPRSSIASCRPGGRSTSTGRPGGLPCFRVVAPARADRFMRRFSGGGRRRGSERNDGRSDAVIRAHRRGRACRRGTCAARRRMGPRRTARSSSEGRRSRGLRHPGADLRRLLERLGRVDTVGESFAVFKDWPASTSRSPAVSRRPAAGTRDSRWKAIRDLSFEDAARRRDFTINAISRDPLTNEIIDPFDGRRDLRERPPARGRSGTIRRRQPARASRVAVRRAFRADRSDARRDRSCRSIPLDDLPPERVWGEMEKLLLQAARPSIGLALALDLGVVDRLWPELKALVGCPQEPEWHPEGDVWVHTLMVVDQARARIDDLDRGPAVAMMLGALCHDLGKPATTAVIDGRIRSPGPRGRRRRAGDALLDRLNVHYARRVRRPSRGARPRRASLEAERVQESRDPGRRRRLPATRAEGRPRAARPVREGRLSRPLGRRSTARRWTGSSNGRGPWASSTPRRRRSSWADTCSIWASRPGRMGDSSRRLRASTRRRRSDAGAGTAAAARGLVT